MKLIPILFALTKESVQSCASFIDRGTGEEGQKKNYGYLVSSQPNIAPAKVITRWCLEGIGQP